jgi:hypothetical protein
MDDEHGDLLSAAPETTAAEILKQAQALVQAQFTASSAIDAKLTTILGQGTTLAVASLGGATLPLATGAWMKDWAGVGLAACGLSAAVAASLAVWGLRCGEWAAPGLSPEKTSNKEVLTAKPGRASLLMAWAYDEAINENRTKLKAAARTLQQTMALLAAAPLVGVISAGVAWSLPADQWPVSLVLASSLVGFIAWLSGISRT